MTVCFFVTDKYYIQYFLLTLCHPLQASGVILKAWAKPATNRADLGTIRHSPKSPKPNSGADCGKREMYRDRIAEYPGSSVATCSAVPSIEMRASVCGSDVAIVRFGNQQPDAGISQHALCVLRQLTDMDVKR